MISDTSRNKPNNVHPITRQFIFPKYTITYYKMQLNFISVLGKLLREDELEDKKKESIKRKHDEQKKEPPEKMTGLCLTITV